MAKVIDQRKITKYCKRQRALNKVKKIQDAEHKEILEALKEEWELPVGGPYVIELAPNGGKEPYNWKKAYEDVLTSAKVKKLGVPRDAARILAQAEMEKREKAQPEKPALTIGGVQYVGGVKFNVRVNEAYRVVESPVDAVA